MPLEIGKRYRIDFVDGWVEAQLVEIDNGTAIMLCDDAEKRAYSLYRLKRLEVKKNCPYCSSPGPRDEGPPPW